MIIDLILDRYHGDAYDPKKFYDAVMDYEEGTEYPISRALDGGEEEDVKRALCDYIDGEYNPNIKKFINAVEWLTGDDGKDYSKEINIMAEKKESTGKKDEMKVTPEVAALFVKGEDGHSQIYKGLCDVCEGTTAHVLQYEEAQEPSRWVSANLVFDESGYEVLVYDYGENEISYSIKDEYGNNLKDYISAARGAPLGKQKGYTPDNIDDMWIALEDDLGKLESDSENESKNESDFGAFDWTVTVSYIDNETGDKVSDVFLIKAHNMPSAKEQAILRANRKGTDAKVDSCRMGDYVSNESKTSEASRKWRADPADRGVGGKWGPADTYNINRDDREQSAKNWKDQGTLDSEFIGLLKSELNKSGTPFKVNDGNKDSASVGFIAKASDFGINDIDMSMVGRDTVDCDDSNLPRNGIARLLNKICKDVLEDDRKGGAGVGVTFGSSNEASYDTVWLDIFYPSIDDPDLTLGAYPTRKEIVTYSIDVAKKVTDYLKKMASTINKEASRKFGKQESKSMNKCSMQKKIESLGKKSEVKDNEIPYVMMQYYVPDEKVWEPVLVEINSNGTGWYYDGLALMDNLGNFGYDEFSWDFIHQRCKRGTDKCDPELVQSMEKFYLKDFTPDDEYQPRKVDRLGNHIPKGKGYIGKA